MIRKLTDFEKQNLHRKIVYELRDQLIIIPNYTEFDDADRRGETLYYEFFEEYVVAIKHFYLSNYSEKPMIVKAFREALNKPNLEWLGVRDTYIKRGGRVFWGWSKERYLLEYPKAVEMPKRDKLLIEVKYGLVRVRCDDFENFPPKLTTKQEKWEIYGKALKKGEDLL